MEIIRWFFVGFATIYFLVGFYLIFDMGWFLIKWEISERKYRQQIKQEEKDNLKHLAEEVTQKEISQKQFEEVVRKQIEENEKWK